jgi:hypothetical protein
MIDKKTILERALELAMVIAALLFVEVVYLRLVIRAALLQVLIWLPVYVAMLYPKLGRWRWLLLGATGISIAGWHFLH